MWPWQWPAWPKRPTSPDAARTPACPTATGPTQHVLVHPDVIAAFLVHAAMHPENEVGALLLGRIEGSLVIEDLVFASQIGTAVNIHFTPQDFDDAAATAREGRSVVGWAHSHPRYGAFLSATDRRFQTQGQGLFRDWIALVLDPFHPSGIQFAFLRSHDQQEVHVPHDYLEDAHAA